MLIRKYGSLTHSSSESFESGGIHPYHHEILYIAEGQIQLYGFNRIYAATGPALFFITPNTPHLMVKVSKHCSYLFMEIDVQQAAFLSHEESVKWNAMQCKAQAPCPYLSVVYETVRKIKDHIDSPLTNRLPFIDKLLVIEIQKLVLFTLHVIAEADEHSSESARAQHPPTWDTNQIIETLAHYMECFYQADLTLQDLADFAHLNPSYLIRLFKQAKGVTPFQYLKTVRMNAALSYLRNSDLSIQDIVKMTGFGSIHYFSRVFKMSHSESPSAWRNKHVGKF